MGNFIEIDDNVYINIDNIDVIRPRYDEAIKENRGSNIYLSGSDLPFYTLKMSPDEIIKEIRKISTLLNRR